MSAAEYRDAQCADHVDLNWPVLAGHEHTLLESCDDEEQFFVCDAEGKAGPCGLLPLCDGLLGSDNDCEQADTACCYVLYSRPCSSCEPQPQACSAVCGVLAPAEGLQSDDLGGPAEAPSMWGQVLAPPADDVPSPVPEAAGVPAAGESGETDVASPTTGLSRCPAAGLVGHTVATVCWVALATVVVVT